MTARAPVSSWKVFQLQTFDRLRNHVLHCPRCAGPAPSLPADAVLVSNQCESGIVLLTEWHTAKCHAEREAFEARP